MTDLGQSPRITGRHFVIRTPLLPADTLLEWSADCCDASATAIATLRERLRVLVRSPEIEEAIFLASPELHASLDQWEQQPDTPNGRKIERALTRYISRMTTRPTPFGLFAGLSVGAIHGRTTRLDVSAPGECGRATRLDCGYVAAVAASLHVDDVVGARMRLRPNPTLYVVHGRIRYLRTRSIAASDGVHLLAERPLDPDLARVLEWATTGASAEELVRRLAAETADVATSEELVRALVRDQVLVSYAGIAVTGSSPTDALVRELESAAPDHPALRFLKVAEHTLRRFDEHGLRIPPSRYRRLAGCAPRLRGESDPEVRFQVDLWKPDAGAELGPDVRREIEMALDLLPKLALRSEGPIDRFRTRFEERYAQAQVPLVEALDPDGGIVFESHVGSERPVPALLRGLGLPSPEPPTQWKTRPRDAVLLGKLQAGTHEVCLDDQDIAHLCEDGGGRLPPTFLARVVVSATSRAALDRGDFRILVDGGGSGARLLGRFCHLHPTVDEMVRAHLCHEEASFPDAIFAEVVYIDEPRMGNLQCRPVLRDYEIPLAGISGTSPDRRLPISDLLVSVEDGRVVLRSRRLGREIIPRVTTSQAFLRQGITAYRFLCHLQSQGVDPYAFDWGPLRSAPFLPRLVHGRLVLSEARWRLSERRLSPLRAAMHGSKSAVTAEQQLGHRARVFEAASELRRAVGLPRFVTVHSAAEGLVVDLDNAFSVDSFARLATSRGDIELREPWPAMDALVAEGRGRRYVHECLVPFASRRTHVVHARHRAPSPARRSFAPGSEWLYAKIHCGPAIADEVLRGPVATVRREAIDSGAADRWFFLRLADHGPDAESTRHLRVRFHGDPQRLCAEVIPALHRALRPAESGSAVRRLEFCTYDREVERYGGAASIASFEELFWADSDATLELLEVLAGRDDDERWRLAWLGVHDLFDDFGLDAPARSRIVARACEEFAKEFSAGSALRKEIGGLYRKERDILFALGDGAVPARGVPDAGVAALRRRSDRFRPIVLRLHDLARRRELVRNLEACVPSLAHMFVNRLVHDRAREQEFVVYDLMRRSYSERAARCSSATVDVSTAS